MVILVGTLTSKIAVCPCLPDQSTFDPARTVAFLAIRSPAIPPPERASVLGRAMRTLLFCFGLAIGHPQLGQVGALSDTCFPQSGHVVSAIVLLYQFQIMRRCHRGRTCTVNVLWLTATSIYTILGYPKVGYSLNGMNVDANRACGSCLSQIRREQGITQVELAKRLRTPQSFVSKIETGERSLKVYEQFAYAEALGITPEEMTARLKASLDY